MGEIIKWPKPSTPLPFTGERLTTAYGGQTEIEHLHRYLMAREWCRDKDVLDVASGEGYGTALLAQVARSAVGLEIAPEAVDHANGAYRTNNLSFVVGDARSLPSPEATFDVVTSFETIEHFAEQGLFLGEIRRVLRPGGLLIISTPDRDNYSPIESTANPFHVRELAREEFDTLLRSYFAEVSVVLQRPIFGSVLLPNGGNRAAPLCFERRGDEHFEGSLNLPRPQYVVAFASANPIPALPPSVYIDTGRLGMLRPSEADAQLRLLRDELAGAREEVNALIAANEMAERACAVVRHELGGAREETKGLREEANGLREEANGLREEANRLREEVKGLQEEVKGLQEEVKGLQEEVKGLQEEAKDRQAAKEMAEHANESLRGELTECQQNLGSLRDELAQCQEELLHARAAKRRIWPVRAFRELGRFGRRLGRLF
jgi:SAM-dependent methyltransferase/uncharacterized coiled-coil DUF342 family protein